MMLYLVRHPEVDVAPGVCYGSTDLPLKPEWKHLVPGTSALLPPGAAAFSSPLKRSLEFAQAVMPSCRTDVRLQELDFGAWEMRPWQSLPPDALETWASDILHNAPHSGETYASLWARISELKGELLQLGLDDVVLFGHAGPLRTFLMQCLAIPAKHYPAFEWDFGGITALKLSEREARLVYHNRAVLDRS